MPVSFSGLRSTSTFSVGSGGTGNNTLTSGSLLVGNGTDPVAFIDPGSEGQVLTVVNGEWAAADAAAGGGGGGGGLSSISTSGNLQGNGTSGSPATLKANISLTSVTASFSGNGAALTNLTASQIGGLNGAIDARLPSVTNIPNSALQNSSITVNGQNIALGGSGNISVGISSVSSSGNLQGNGTNGSELTLKDNISLNSVTASFNGNGAGITGLSTSQLSNFNTSVDARITNIPNSALQNSSITVNGSAVSLGGSVTIPTSSANPSFTSITAETGTISGDLTVQGSLFVNGTQTVVNTTDLTITDNIILIASGASNASQLNGAGIHFGRLPSEDARIVYDSTNDWMEIHPGISASSIRGAFAGDGSSLTGLVASQIGGLNAAVDARITNIPNSALQNSSISINGTPISLGGSTTLQLGLTSVSSSGNLTGSGVSGNPIILKDNISLTSVTASLKGDGSQITGLTAAQVSGIISSVSSSGNIQGSGTSGSPITLKSAISLTSVTASFSGNGAGLTSIPNSALQNSAVTINGSSLSLGGSLTLTSAVSSSGNLSGTGTGADPITLKSNISLTSVTASFSGNGSALTNLTASQLSNFQSDVRGQLSAGSNLSYASGQYSLNGNVSLTSVTASFSGNGAGITGLTSTQLSDFNSAVDARLPAQSDASVMTFTATGVSVGNVVALSGTLVVADYSDTLKSNVIGVASAVAGTTVTVKLFGEVTATSASLVSSVGTPVYVGPSGSVVQYSGIASGKYITQVGYISPNSGKVIVQPRVFGQMA